MSIGAYIFLFTAIFLGVPGFLLIIFKPFLVFLITLGSAAFSAGLLLLRFFYDVYLLMDSYLRGSPEIELKSASLLRRSSDKSFVDLFVINLPRVIKFDCLAMDLMADSRTTSLGDALLLMPFFF